MKKIFCFLIIALGAVSLCAQSLNVMTFNIRFNNASDKKDAWPYRRNYVANHVLFHDVQILGVQEALLDQMVI